MTVATPKKSNMFEIAKLQQTLRLHCLIRPFYYYFPEQRLSVVAGYGVFRYIRDVMGKALTLQLAIPTHAPEGIRRIEKLLLPPREGVGYIVSWQDHREEAVPETVAARADVEILRFDGKGLSANRDNALAHCTADIVLIGDDDLVYRPDAFDTVRQTFERDPALEYASFRYDGPDDKRYPVSETSLSPIPKGFSQTTFEIAIRRESRAGKLRFSPLFGPGAPYLTAGEDEFFLLSAVKSGVNCRFFPSTIANHPTLTSGALPRSSAGLLRTTGALIALRHRAMWIPRLPLVAWRLYHSGKAPFISALRAMAAGALYALREFPGDFAPERSGC